jgi:hypothetical protein
MATTATTVATATTIQPLLQRRDARHIDPNVQRRNNGLRVWLMSSGYGGQYGNQHGYQNRSYTLLTPAFAATSIIAP